MFAGLMGHLGKAKARLESDTDRLVVEKRKTVEVLAKKRMTEDQYKRREEEQHQAALARTKLKEKKAQEIESRDAIAVKQRETELALSRAIWMQHERRVVGKFLLTETKPALCWAPKDMHERTKDMQLGAGEESKGTLPVAADAADADDGNADADADAEMECKNQMVSGDRGTKLLTRLRGLLEGQQQRLTTLAAERKREDESTVEEMRLELAGKRTEEGTGEHGQESRARESKARESKSRESKSRTVDGGENKRGGDEDADDEDEGGGGMADDGEDEFGRTKHADMDDDGEDMEGEDEEMDVENDDEKVTLR
jgi:hypothetical protein